MPSPLVRCVMKRRCEAQAVHSSLVRWGFPSADADDERIAAHCSRACIVRQGSSDTIRRISVRLVISARDERRDKVVDQVRHGLIPQTEIAAFLNSATKM